MKGWKHYSRLEGRKTLMRAAGIVLAVSAMAGGSFLGYRAWKGNADYIASLRSSVAEQSARAEGAEKSLGDKTSEASDLSSQLAQTNEKFGVAVSERTQAESAKAKADADAASAKKSAQSSANEAAWQRGLATEANGNLATCSSNEGALANVVLNIDKQKDYYRLSGQYVAEAAKAYIWERWSEGSDAMDSAIYYQDLANDLQPTVDYWLGQIE